MSADALVTLLGDAAVGAGLDWSVTIETAHECAWSIEVRITPEPNAEGADVSTVFFRGGMKGPDECASEIIPDIRRFLDKLRGSWYPQR